MARYKVLPSIAHNFGQSFVGASKERSDDHLLGRLLTDARRTGEPTLRLDILSGEATPDALVTPSLARILERYVKGFPDLVSGDHSDMQYIRAARMELTFDLATERPVEGAATLRESPYVCRVAIDDDRGKSWVAELKGWCQPEVERTGLWRGSEAMREGTLPDFLAGSTVACYTEAPVPPAGTKRAHHACDSRVGPARLVRWRLEPRR